MGKQKNLKWHKDGHGGVSWGGFSFHSNFFKKKNQKTTTNKQKTKKNQIAVVCGRSVEGRVHWNKWNHCPEERSFFIFLS